MDKEVDEEKNRFSSRTLTLIFDCRGWIFGDAPIKFDDIAFFNQFK